MYFINEFVSICVIFAAASAFHYQPHHKYTKEPSYHRKGVNLHKLCSWNVIHYQKAREISRDDSWESCHLDSGRAYIPENNIPFGFGISEDRRVFVSQPRSRTGVYSNLGFFYLDDIGYDEVCPPLTPFPPKSNVTLNADCCTDRNVVNIDRFFIDSFNRLWAVDRQALDLNDKEWNLASPRLLIYDLKTDTLIREAVLSSELYGNGEHQLGLVTVIVNADKNDANNAYAYILDTYFGCIVVYSYAQNKFWRVCTPEFASDAKYSKFSLKTNKNKDITYYKNNLIIDCTRDYKNQQLICHSDAQLDEYTVPFEQLHDEEVARCSPDSLDVHFLGQKFKKGQSTIHTMNRENQVVWTLQEQSYGVACWNREKPLNPDAVKLVVSDHRKLPYVTDLQRTSVDLTRFMDYQCHERQENFVVVFSNNYRSIVEHGFDHKDENFGLYFFVEDEALEAYPQCLYHDTKDYHQKPVYKEDYKEYKEHEDYSYRTSPHKTYKFEPNCRYKKSN